MAELSSHSCFRNVIRVPIGTRQRFLQLEHEAAVPLTKLGVRLSGIGTFGSEYYVGYREPSCHLLLYTLDGTGFFRWNEQEIRPVGGELLISPAGVPMLLGTLDRPWTFLWFYIHGLERWKHLERTQPHLFYPSFGAQLHNGLEGLMAETGHAFSQSVLTESGWVARDPLPILPSSRAAILFGELVAEYLFQILNVPSRELDPWHQKLQSLWREVEQSPGMDWSQESICRKLNTSPATLQRLIRRLFDSSPQKMVMSIRMRQARRLLQQSDYPLAVIAREIGYADAFVLSAAFKRFHGHPPSFFREAISED